MSAVKVRPRGAEDCRVTCHRPNARHCSCNPEVGGAGEPEVLIVSIRDPQAALAVRSLAAALATDVVVRAPGVLEIRGDVSALMVAMASAVPVASLPALTSPESAEDAPAPHRGSERVVPLVELARRDELVARLDTEIAHQRTGTTTGVVFCDVSGGGGAGSPGAVVLGVAAARLRAVLRRSDTLAHLGDGLFVAVVADLPVQGADEVAARSSAGVRACFDEPFATSSGLFVVAPLVGVVIHPGPLDTVRLDSVEATSGSEAAQAAGVAMSGADLVRAVERSLARRPGVLG